MARGEAFKATDRGRGNPGESMTSATVFRHAQIKGLALWGAGGFEKIKGVVVTTSPVKENMTRRRLGGFFARPSS